MEDFILDFAKLVKLCQYDGEKVKDLFHLRDTDAVSAKLVTMRVFSPQDSQSPLHLNQSPFSTQQSPQPLPDHQHLRPHPGYGVGKGMTRPRSPKDQSSSTPAVERSSRSSSSSSSSNRSSSSSSSSNVSRSPSPPATPKMRSRTSTPIREEQKKVSDFIIMEADVEGECSSDETDCFWASQEDLDFITQQSPIRSDIHMYRRDLLTCNSGIFLKPKGFNNKVLIYIYILFCYTLNLKLCFFQPPKEQSMEEKSPLPQKKQKQKRKSAVIVIYFETMIKRYVN